MLEPVYFSSPYKQPKIAVVVIIILEQDKTMTNQREAVRHQTQRLWRNLIVQLGVVVPLFIKWFSTFSF